MPGNASPAEEPDTVLIARMSGGDDAAMRTLYERHAGWIATRLRRTLAREATEDVLQETFVAVWRSASTYRGTGDVGGWIWTIARNQAVSWARKHGKPAVALELLGEQPAAARDLTDEVHASTQLRQALATASESGELSAEIAHRVFVEDQPMKQIATELGLPIGTVKSRLHRIRAAVRERMDAE